MGVAGAEHALTFVANCLSTTMLLARVERDAELLDERRGIGADEAQREDQRVDGRRSSLPGTSTSLPS